MTEARLNYLAIGVMHVAIGLAIVALPWLLEFHSHHPDAANTMWATGGVIAVLGVLMAANLSPVVGVVTLLGGIWAIAAPFVLDFADMGVGAWLFIGAGALITIMSLALIVPSRSRPMMPA